MYNKVENPKVIYMNSFIHYKDKTNINVYGKNIEVYLYLLDKRFIKCDIFKIHQSLPNCKIKDLDDYWYLIYSSNPINIKNIFEYFLSNDIIISVYDFITMLR